MKNNTKLLLTIASCIGTIAVAVVASHDKTKAEKLLNDSEYQPKGELKHDIIEPMKICWKAYIPTVVVAGMTITSIIVNHKLTKKEIASISACAVGSMGLLSNYKQKIEARYGHEGLEEIIRDVAHDHEDNAIKAKNVCIYGSGGITSFEDPSIDCDTLFYDEWSDTWFRSSLFNVKNAMYHFNRNFALAGENSLEDFYNLLGIKPLGNIDLEYYGYGNNILEDGIFWVDFDLIESKNKDTGETYYIISFVWAPGVYDENEATYVHDDNFMTAPA